MNYKQLFLSILIVSIFLVVGVYIFQDKMFVSDISVQGASVFKASQGGTGKGSAIAEDVGKVLQVSDDSPFTYTFATVSGGGGGGTAIGMREGYSAAFTNKTSISFDAGGFNLSTINADARLSLDYVNGPASRSTANTWSGLNIFSIGASVSTNLEVGGITSFSNSFWAGNGNLGIGTTAPTTKLNVIGNASVSGDFEIGTNNFLFNANRLRISVDKYIQLCADVDCVADMWIYGATSVGAGVFESAYSGTGFNIDGITGNMLVGPNVDTATTSYGLAVAGTASVSSGFFGSGLTDCINATASKLLWTASTGMFSCGVDQSGGGGGTQIELSESLTQDAGTKVSSVSFVPNGFNVSFPAGGLVNLDYANGPASKTMANTWSQLQTFSASPLSIQGTSASLSLNFEATGYASASKNYGAGLTACTANGGVIQWTGGVFSCHTLGSADIPALDSTLIALAALDGTTGFLGVTGVDTFVRRTFTGTTNQIGITNGDSQTGNPVFSITSPFIVPNSASISGKFEMLNWASVSGAITQHSVASNSFSGSITGNSDNTLSLGAIINKLKQVISNIGQFIVSLIVPNGSGGPTMDTAGQIGVNTNVSSPSFDVYADASYVVPLKVCRNGGWLEPVLGDDFPIIYFEQPFTITDIVVIASSSNSAVTSVGFNVTYGKYLTSVTNVFIANHNASSSTTSQHFSGFANSNIRADSWVSVTVASSSIETKSFNIAVCGKFQ